MTADSDKIEFEIPRGSVYHSGRDGSFDGEFGGACPVQGFGSVQRQHDEKPASWYFRSRGDAWTLTVGTADDEGYVPHDLTIWSYGEPFGVWPEAGWLSAQEANSCITKALTAYLRS